LGAAVNHEGKVVTHPLDKKVIGDFGEPLSSLLQVDRSHVEYCLTQVTKIAGEMKRRRRGVGGGGGERGRRMRRRERREGKGRRNKRKRRKERQGSQEEKKRNRK